VGAPSGACAAGGSPGAAGGQATLAPWAPLAPLPAWVPWTRRSPQSSSVAQPQFLHDGRRKRSEGMRSLFQLYSQRPQIH
ncbi:hypothetical protein Nmel_017451, partial [Mimus melanotis]